MATNKPIDFKVLRKNKYGHRFILEPTERIKFRERCKDNIHGTICNKGYDCYVDGGCLIGCTANVSCPRLQKWDKRHGLELPYTMVENKYPDLKPTSFTWHPATESPGKRRVVIALRTKGHENEYMTFNTVRFLAPYVTPATCVFKMKDGTKQLAVAWAYYDEIIKGIAPWMVERAEGAAWPWWPDNANEDNNM